MVVAVMVVAVMAVVETEAVAAAEQELDKVKAYPALRDCSPLCARSDIKGPRLPLRQ